LSPFADGTLVAGADDDLTSASPAVAVGSDLSN